MKNIFSIGLLLSFLICVGCASTSSSGITSADVATEPTVFCKVLNEPSPTLLGGWKCDYWGTSARGNRFSNPVQYWLVKKGDQYALYYYFTKYSGRERVTGWQDWTINGKEITNSDKAIRFFAQNGLVYFSWQGEKPIKMSRIQ